MQSMDRDEAATAYISVGGNMVATFLQGWDERGRFGVPFDQSEQSEKHAAYAAGVEARIMAEKTNRELTP